MVVVIHHFFPAYSPMKTYHCIGHQKYLTALSNKKDQLTPTSRNIFFHITVSAICKIEARGVFSAALFI